MQVAVVGDYSLDRYLEIDPRLNEKSIETGRTVHNVTNVRSQAGSAGTIVNNLSALGVGRIFPIGFCGVDGEGFELVHSLKKLAGVDMKWFLRTKQRRTFTYCKPLITRPNRAPEELDRLDSKNWTHTPRAIEKKLISSLLFAAEQVDAIILMDQVDIPESGVISKNLLESVDAIRSKRRKTLIIGDSRRGLKGFPPIVFKMNSSELSLLVGHASSNRLDTIKRQAHEVARKNGKPVFITMAENGILGVTAAGEAFHQKVLAVDGEIDIVGAGDAVTANIAVALAAGAKIGETISLANAAAHVVVHQLGTTGTASINQISQALGF